jgi:hypothetical protein
VAVAPHKSGDAGNLMDASDFTLGIFGDLDVKASLLALSDRTCGCCECEVDIKSPFVDDGVELPTFVLSWG